MSTNYSEQIFQSIDTIISQRLNEVSFDKTEICEIISQDKDNINKYWVSNGSLKYEAYSIDENRKYLANQKVYVTIPQDNYDLRKLIIGSYSTDESNENLYVNPFNHLVTSSSHKVSNITITTNTSGNSTSDFKDLEIRFNYSNTIDFDYIGLEFGLDTSFLQDTYKGTYSIELQIYNNENKQLNTSRIVLYNTDLYGNPYGLIPMLKFQHLFPFPKEIKKITDIAKIRVLLAQDGNFEKEGNIKLQDIKLYFGYDTKTITKYELSLILEEGQNLKYTTGETAAARTLYLDWKHFDISNIPHIFNIYQSPNIFDYYKVYWLHYVDGLGKNSNLPDEYAWNWETITNNINLTQGITLTTLYRTDQYKVVIEYKYKNNETIYYAESTGLVFDNTDVAADPGASNSSGDSLRIKLNEGDTGIYNVYGLDGRMMDYSYKGPHNIHFEFLDTTSLDRIASINWEFPSENTMIKDVANIDKQQATFNIDTMYKPGAMNNRIWCTVTLVTGEIRRGSLTLQFGEAAAAGSNYAFNIDFKGHRTCLYATGKNDSVEIQAIFTKQNGEVMTVPTITWSWMNGYDSPITLSRTTGESITLTYNNSKVPKENYSILQAKINDYAIDNGLTTNLTAYLPIPIAKPEYNYISGATRVVYDSNGNTATYSRNPYELYNLTKKIENTSWDIISNSTNDTFQLKTQNIRDKNGNIIGEEKTLLPLSYIPQKPPMTCVYCILNGNIVWSQPILIIQNRWEYDLLNKWNGKLQSDDTSYVLAPLLGAGKKENNAFTGVMMGDLKIANHSISQTGLYGFKEGGRRFSFNDKGEAYIGTGDYYFNLTEDGSLSIKVNTFNLETKYLTLKSDDNGYLLVGDQTNENYLEVNKDTFYLCSDSFYFGGEDSNLIIDSDDQTISVYDNTGEEKLKLGRLNWWDNKYGLEVNGGTFTIYDESWHRKLAFDPNDGILYVDGNITNSYGSNSYLKVGAINNTIQMSYYYEDTEYFSVWPSTNEDCVISGKNGIIITNTDNNSHIAEFTTSKSGIYSGYGEITLEADNIYLQDSGSGNTCLVQIWGGFEANYYDSSNQSWYYTIKANRTSSGGTLYGKWNYGTLSGSNITSTGTIQGNSMNVGNSNYQLWISSSNDFVMSTKVNNIKLAYGSNNTIRLAVSSSGGNLYGTWTQPTWTSDRRLKHSIEELNENYEILFDNLIPKRYKYNNGTSNRYHTGFIAQEVLTAVEQANLTTQDFAAMYLTEREDSELNEPVWILRRDEFVALNTWQIQKLKTRVAELENEIKEIKKHYEI